ncbi:MAG TPA: hypothetical protein VIU93_03985 [Gallionellaceae bacterium]
MNNEERENCWNQLLIAQSLGDECGVLRFAEHLSDSGDWRGSYSLGYVHEVRATNASTSSGRVDTENFVIAAQYYERAITQGGQFAPHNALAKIYYYGLGGWYDFRLAYKHLACCIEYASSQTLSDDLLSAVTHNQVMIAELLFLGLGVNKDMRAAERLFASVAKEGMPVAYIGLSRIARAEKHYFQALVNYFQALRLVRRLVSENREHPLLAGVGGKRGTFRRDWIQHAIQSPSPSLIPR